MARDGFAGQGTKGRFMAVLRTPSGRRDGACIAGDVGSLGSAGGIGGQSPLKDEAGEVVDAAFAAADFDQGPDYGPHHVSQEPIGRNPEIPILAGGRDPLGGRYAWSEAIARLSVHGGGRDGAA